MNTLTAALAATLFALTAQAQKPVKPDSNQPVGEASKRGKGAPGAQGGKGSANAPAPAAPGAANPGAGGGVPRRP